MTLREDFPKEVSKTICGYMNLCSAAKGKDDGRVGGNTTGEQLTE